MNEKSLDAVLLSAMYTALTLALILSSFAGDPVVREIMVGLFAVLAWFVLEMYCRHLHDACEHCKSKLRTLHWHPKGTAYHWDGKGLNPNGRYLVCKPCGEAADDHWRDMWANVPQR